jgi:O-antigen/teichoic acid export membrane protein
VSLSVKYLGHARKRLPIAVGAVLVNLVINLILVPPIGVVAGAIGT